MDAESDTDLTVEMWCIDNQRRPAEHPRECSLTMIVDEENPPLIAKCLAPLRVQANHRLMEIETDMEPSEDIPVERVRQFRHLTGAAVNKVDEDEVRPFPESLHGKKIQQTMESDIEEEVAERYS